VTLYKIGKTTAMWRVFEHYASARGMRPNASRFLLDGERVHLDSTPVMLELEKGDQLDSMVEPTGY